MRSPSTALLLLLLGWLAACGPPADPVEALLESLEEAVEEKDTVALRARLADDFVGENGLRADPAVEQAQRFLMGYETVSLDYYDVQIQRNEGSAQVQLRTDFTGRAKRIGPLAGLLPPDASYRFEMELIESDEGWKVSRASWEPAPLADEP